MKTAKKLLIALLILAALLLVLDAGCVFYQTVGIPCPGCGMTRACLKALSFDFPAAFRMHPLWPITPPLILLLIFREGKLLHNPQRNRKILLLLLIIYLGIYLYRMLTLFPHTVPMVYNEQALLPILYKFLFLKG